MSRKKLLVLDEPYHAQTRSSDFFVDLLRTRFDVTVDYLNASPRDWEACVKQVRSHAPDLVVLWQVSLRAKALLELGIPVIWVPMYDQSRRRWHQNYLEAAQAGVSVVAFSKVVGQFARSWKLKCLDVCYYPVHSSQPVVADFKRALLWYRGFIEPREVWPSLRTIPDLQVVIKSDVDPTSTATIRDDGEIASLIERVVEGFLPKDEYFDLVNGCGIFVAPRTKEGIGLSFLEAMARGACVVAYDSPTMSEYIVHGVTGWLFSESSSSPLPASSVAAIGRAAHQQVVAGRAKWELQVESMLDYVADVGIPKRQRGLGILGAKVVGESIRILTPLKHRLLGK